MHIESLQNPRIKQLIKLRKRRDRDESHTFIIEGYRELLRALDAGRRVNDIFICPEFFLGENEESLIQKGEAAGAQVFTCNQKVFEKISYRDRPDGLLAVAPQSHLSLDALSLENPFYIVAEAIEKPGNLGTILRSADAVGAGGCIVCDQCTDIHNPNVVRASVGTLFTLPVVEATSGEAIGWLKKNKIAILAATPHAKVEYTKVNMNRPLAIAVGTEQYGLSDQWMKEADLQVRIPMLGVADSLNVAMATSLLMYEALRQRRNAD